MWNGRIYITLDLAGSLGAITAKLVPARIVPINILPKGEQDESLAEIEDN